MTGLRSGARVTRPETRLDDPETRSTGPGTLPTGSPISTPTPTGTGERNTRNPDSAQQARRLTDARGGRITCPEMAAAALLLGAFVVLLLAIVSVLR